MSRIAAWFTGIVAVSLVTTTASTGVAAGIPAVGGTVVAVADATDVDVPGATDIRTFTYRTSGAEGVSSAQVFVPEGRAPDGGWPVLAWAHGTVGMADEDAPSRSGVMYEIYRNLFADWLRRGFVIVATDYAGLGTPGVHPYLNADVAAHNVVDSVRAVHELVPAVSDRWAVAGQSQGGHAALATAARAEILAPELDFRGTLASGAPVNLDRLAALAGPEFPDLQLDGLTLYMAYIAAGLRDTRPDLDVDGYLTPRGRELVDAADTMPLAQFKPRANEVQVRELFNRPLAGTAFPQALTEYLGVPTTGFDRPVMLIQGLGDQVVPPPLALWFAAELALAGGKFDLRLPSGGHVDGLAQSSDEVGAFLDRVLR
ncbi:pimeloyl-ACP methyl ester carboxylesterase [Rhodococcus sp. 27YEA15]|uniref:lipase family protein n=1 Tax=Rhodococcus sp. 27YEA15 TaxID=3156259 RepID=UPI003C7E4199